MDYKRGILKVILYFLICFISEKFYRDLLFKYSLTKIEEVQNSYSITSIHFFSVISLFGKFEGIILIMTLIFNFFPISKSFILVNSYSFSCFSVGFLKFFYQDPRPFYVNRNIIPYNCESDYGNPSGHVLNSTIFFLGVLSMLNDTKLFKNNNILKYSFSFFIFLLISMLMFSRFLLGVHSLNQIIFGLSLGLGMYYFFFELNIIKEFSNGKNFFQIFTSTHFNLISFSIYFTFILISLGIYKFSNFDHKYLNFILNVCSHNPSYKVLENYEFCNILFIFVLIGSHLGILLLIYSVKKYYCEDEIINFDSLNKFDFFQSEKKNLLRYLLILILNVIVFVPFFLVNDANSFLVILTFKISFPFFLFGFIIYGIIPLICLKFDIYSDLFFLEFQKNIDYIEHDFSKEKKDIYII